MVQNPRKRFEYEKVRFFRSKGYSYREIKKEIKVSKSSISLWCRDVKLSPEQKKNLKERGFNNLLLSVEKRAKILRERREKEILAIRELAKKEIRYLNFENFKITGTALYWAEGAKTSGTCVSNSDPKIIKFMVDWFNKVLEIPPVRLKAHLHIHYRNDDKKIKKYWSKLTRIPLKNFGKSFIKPKGTGHRTNILPNGVIKIRVLGKGSGDLRHRILAWSEKIYELGVK